MTQAARHRLLLVMVCAAAFLPGLVGRTLWPPDEPRYALVARDMIERHDYVVPRKAGEVYHSQPPLFLWAEALAAHLLGGMSETAARLPSFVAALSCVLVTRGLAAGMFGPSAGLAAGLVLATSLRFMLSAQWAATDMLLCALVTAALARVWRVVREESLRAWPAWALAGLAALTKGPVGLVLPALVSLAGTPGSGARRFGVLRPGSGAAVAALVVAPWYLAYAWGAGGGLAANLILQQSVRRYLEAWNNVQPWHYFLWRLPLDLLPWSPALLVALGWSLRRMPAPERRFLWAWLGVVFLFFTLSSGKRGVYILPLYPAAAILIGWCLVQGAAPGTGPRWLASTARRAPALVVALAGAGLLYAWLQHGAQISRFGVVPVWLAVVAFAAGASSSLVPHRAVVPCTAAAVVLLSMIASLWAVPLENRRQNVVVFAADIARRVPPGRPLAIVEDRYEDLVYYSRRDASMVRPGASLRRWLSGTADAYAVLDERAWIDLRSIPGVDHEVLSETALAGDPYRLVLTRNHGEDSDARDTGPFGGGAAPQ
ncbi:MAG: ArnT family glycosyltransferase [Candidatus Polarisedimenticolia bacterium]